MSLWSDLPSGIRDSGGLDTLEPVLDSVATPTASDETDSDGAWRVYRTNLGDSDPLSLDPSTGRFRRAPGTGSTPIEFPDPQVGLELRLHLDAPGGSPDGWVQLIVAAPKAIVRLPFLKGARLDAQGQLREDPQNRDVKFHLPAIRIRVEREAAGEVGVEVLSASTSGSPVDEIYEFIRMEPNYALIGPGDVVGFAFRTAVLDLSATSGPSGVPSGAFAMPTNWQGFYLPEARVFVAPSGLEGLAVSGGVRNMWIGIGDHAGVTGTFEAEVVNRGSEPTVRLRFQTPSGEWIGVPDTDPTTPIQLPATSRLYVDAGGGLAPHAISITVAGTTTTADRVDVTTPDTGTVAISVSVSDAGSHTTTRSITLARRSSGGGATSPGGATPVALRRTSSGFGRIRLVSQSASHATVDLDPPGGSIAWTWTGGGSAIGATAEIPVAVGATVEVTATRSLTTEINCYMLFDQPDHRSDQARLERFALNPDKTRTEPAASRDDWSGGTPFRDTSSVERFADYPAGTTWTVDGYASFEGDNTPFQISRNDALSARRRDALIHLVETLTSVPSSSITIGTAHGHSLSRGSTNPPPRSSTWWRATAVATLPAGASADETVTAELTRPATPPSPPDVDPRPTQAPTPDCFRKLGFRIELIRGTFVRAEVYGEFDIRTAAEQRLAANSAGPLPARTNPNDGISTFLVRLRIAEDRTSWQASAEFRAVEGDLDGLAKAEAPATGTNAGLNILGAVSALSPLLAAVTPPSPRDAEIVPMIVASAAAIGIGASGVMTTKHVILRGGELIVTDGVVDPSTGSGPDTTQVSILLDLETAFTFDLGFIRVRPDQPVKTRYKAVGVRSTWSSSPRADGTIEYLPLPVFDPSKGYTLDVPAGSLVAADPLGEILRILGVRVSRDNPTYLEVEVGMGVDLGIVTVDTARVRLRLDQLEPPELTKLGASLEIPGTLTGRGVVEITSAGFKGAFDLTITPISIRATASLAVETVDDVTGVLIGAEVEFPVPIVLGSSGLGIYGFMGGVGVNYARDEPTGVTVPALRWLEAQLRRTGGVMDPAGWSHSPGGMAFAAGMLVGTLEGGFVVHLKGIILIELPGPRLLLVMKADVLQLPPELDSEQSATFLAVLDIDFGRGTITIGVVAEYTIERLLEIRVPVTAFFDTDEPEKWFVDLGTFIEPVTVKVLEVIEGTGYLMVHGDGIENPPVPILTSGLTIATGFHISAVLMGSKSAGLYLEVAAGFDAVISLEPFAIGGVIYARGELRLFIISIGASAKLTVLVGRQLDADENEVDRTYVHGEVCGKIDFFFFSIKGCVSLTIGDQPPAIPPAPDLVTGVVLIGRSPALIEGAAIDRTVDGKLADAVPAADGGPRPTVPLDAIPVILFAAPTDVQSGNVVLEGEARGSSGLPANPWLQRGDRWWRYRVTKVELTGALTPTDGDTPATWWARGLPGDTSHGPALALLDWLPTPTPRAVTYGETLTTQTRERWGRICDIPAEPAPVLWTFDAKPLGASEIGWTLHGLPWPDPPGSYRSDPVDAMVHVTEPWRTGDPQIDRVQGTDPAVVVGDAVPCSTGDDPPVITDIEQWMGGQPSTFSEGAPQYDNAAAGQLAELLADGAALADVSATRAASAWVPDMADPPLGCEGRILRSPRGDLDVPGGHHPVEQEEVQQRWEELGYAPSELSNAIAIKSTSGLEALVLLLLMPVEFEEGMFVLRYRDAGGGVVNEEPLRSSHVVSPGNPVPGPWTDPGGPWADPIGRAGRLAARLASGSKRRSLYLIDCETSPDVVEVELGWVRGAFQRRTAPVFHLVAASGLTATETGRHEWDDTEITKERELIETTLNQDPDDHALLVPGTSYTVRVTWESASIEQDSRPTEGQTVTWIGPRTQDFEFSADPASEAPTDLAPWMLASTPSAEEPGVLCREPVMVALATQNVANLFAAYGEELRVVVRSATGRHPSPPGGSPGGHVVIPASTGGVLQALTPAIPIMTPWEQTVQELVGELPCIPADVDRTHHHVVTITYDFDPLTDYLLDIRAVPLGAAADVTGRRVHRIGFSTGGFDTVGDLATMVARAPILHTYSSNPTALTALRDRPSGADLDAAFQVAGLGVRGAPRYPALEVLWSGDATPQPLAVIIESSEALWRERPMPTHVTDTSSSQDPKPKRWVARKTPWLLPKPSTQVPASGEPARTVVSRIIRAPGDARAVLLLAPGSRGSELLVDLVVPTNELYGEPERRAPLFGVHLRRAPWEDG